MNLALLEPLCTDVVALYVDRRGVYPRLVREWYDERRDARTYVGDLPVVAHPPCGPWGPMRGLATKQDPSCGPHAVEVVRRVGGVLEHPAYSRLFRHCGMPFPGELPDAWGGRTYAVAQVAWGHPCDKPTWLYVVGVPSHVVARGFRAGGRPTHRVTSGPRGSALPSASRKLRRQTPPEFARWLVELARGVRR